MSEDHAKHPGVAPFWCGLHPSLPSGSFSYCGVRLANGELCNESRFVPTERCTCNPKWDHVVFTGNPYQMWRPSRPIYDGVCSACRKIVPGMEEEADACGNNW